MEDLKKKIYSKKLKFLRLHSDVPQKELAAYFNISTQAYGKLERGETKFSEKRIIEICAFFKISYSEFVMIKDLKTIRVKANNNSEAELALEKINTHYEILFLESELRNIKLEQKYRNCKPYREVPLHEAPPVYVMI